MGKSNYNVYGNVVFPLNFGVRTNSEVEALKKAELLLNNQNVVKVEIDVYTQDGKCHLIIADEFNFYWTHAEETDKS